MLGGFRRSPTWTKIGMLRLFDVMEELRDNLVVTQLLLRFVLGRDSVGGLGTASKFEVPRVGGRSEGVDSMMEEAILGITTTFSRCCLYFTEDDDEDLREE